MTTKEMYKKYQSRLTDCQDAFDLHTKELSDPSITQDRRDWLHKDIQLLNVQIGVYECIVKDLKEII